MSENVLKHLPGAWCLFRLAWDMHVWWVFDTVVAWCSYLVCRFHHFALFIAMWFWVPSTTPSLFPLLPSLAQHISFSSINRSSKNQWFLWISLKIYSIYYVLGFKMKINIFVSKTYTNIKFILEMFMFCQSKNSFNADFTIIRSYLGIRHVSVRCNLALSCIFMDQIKNTNGNCAQCSFVQRSSLPKIHSSHILRKSIFSHLNRSLQLLMKCSSF